MNRGALAAAVLFGAVGALPGEGTAVAPRTPAPREAVLHFEEGLPTDGTVLERRGGVFVPDGVSGRAFRLGKGDRLVLDARRFAGPDGGTASFWVRPRWPASDPSSHAFLSMKWKDGSPRKDGYLVVSRGWWEPKGTGLVYFVADNRTYANVARRIRFEPGEWAHLAVSWSSGPSGSIRLYANGLRIGTNARTVDAAAVPSPHLHLGSDLGSPLTAGRSADADFDEVVLRARPSTDEEIFAEFLRAWPKGPVRSPRAPFLPAGSRFLFDEGSAWATGAGAREAIRRIKDAGFDVYVPCVWHGGGTRYPSEVAPAERGASFPADPFARLLRIARENGVRVHAWFTAALRQGFDRPGFHPAGAPPDAFDLHRPAVRRFLVGLVGDFAGRYAVDGINLDFVRTMGVCLCADCASEYRERTGRDLRYDAGRAEQNGGVLGAELQAWQDDAVGRLVREVAAAARSARPGIVVSVDGHPRPPHPDPEGRQEHVWANAGLVDLVFDMNYSAPPDAERHHLAAARFDDPRRLVMLVSNHDWRSGRPTPKAPGPLSATVDYAARRFGTGVGVYLYSMLDDAQVAALASGPFRDVAAARPGAERRERR